MTKKEDEVARGRGLLESTKRKTRLGENMKNWGVQIVFRKKEEKLC